MAKGGFKKKAEFGSKVLQNAVFCLYFQKSLQHSVKLAPDVHVWPLLKLQMLGANG